MQNTVFKSVSALQQATLNADQFKSDVANNGGKFTVHDVEYKLTSWKGNYGTYYASRPINPMNSCTQASIDFFITVKNLLLKETVLTYKTQHQAVTDITKTLNTQSQKQQENTSVQIGYPYKDNRLSKADEEKEVNRLNRSLKEIISNIIEKKSEFKGIALIIGSEDGGSIQTDPKFLDSTIKKIYIDYGHLKYNDDGSVSPKDDNCYLVQIEKDNTIQDILPILLQAGGDVFIYDNCAPTKFGTEKDFTYSCAKHILKKTDKDLHKKLHVIIGYVDQYPRFLVKNEYFSDESKKQDFSNFINTSKEQKEGENHYNRFQKVIGNLSEHIEMFSDDNFKVS